MKPFQSVPLGRTASCSNRLDRARISHPPRCLIAARPRYNLVQRYARAAEVRKYSRGSCISCWAGGTRGQALRPVEVTDPGTGTHKGAVVLALRTNGFSASSPPKALLKALPSSRAKTGTLQQFYGKDHNGRRKRDVVPDQTAGA